MVSKLLTKQELNQANIIVIGEINVLEDGNKVSGLYEKLEIVDDFDKIDDFDDELPEGLSSADGHGWAPTI